MTTLSSVVAGHAWSGPDALAFAGTGRRSTWRELGVATAGLAAALVRIGPLAGEREGAHLVALTGASRLVAADSEIFDDSRCSVLNAAPSVEDPARPLAHHFQVELRVVGEHQHGIGLIDLVRSQSHERNVDPRD